MKINDMPLCDRPSRFWEKVGVGDFAPRGAGETNPRGLNYAVASRCKNSGANEPKPLIFPAVYQLQRKPARFSANLNADEDDPSRIRSLKSSDAPSHASIRFASKSSRGLAEGPQLRGWPWRQVWCHGHLGDGARMQNSGRGAAGRARNKPGTCVNQQIAS